MLEIVLHIGMDSLTFDGEVLRTLSVIMYADGIVSLTLLGIVQHPVW